MVVCGGVFWRVGAAVAPPPRCLLLVLLVTLGCWGGGSLARAAPPPAQHPSCGDSELTDDLGRMEKSIESWKCPEDCNAESTSECSCLTFSKSYGKCSAEYFIEGLSKMNFVDLVDRVDMMDRSCFSHQDLVVGCENHVSPRRFLKTLTDLCQQLSSRNQRRK